MAVGKFGDAQIAPTVVLTELDDKALPLNGELPRCNNVVHAIARPVRGRKLGTMAKAPRAVNRFLRGGKKLPQGGERRRGRVSLAEVLRFVGFVWKGGRSD